MRLQRYLSESLTQEKKMINGIPVNRGYKPEKVGRRHGESERNNPASKTGASHLGSENMTGKK